jgi:hypothetical protein
MYKSRFYEILIGDPDSRSALWLENIYLQLSKEEIDEIHYGRLTPPQDVCLHVMSGRKKSDGVGSDRKLKLVSDRVIECLSKIKATGWASYPVKVVRKNGDLLTGYNIFAITHKYGFLDATNAIEKPWQLRPDSKIIMERYGYELVNIQPEKYDFLRPENIMLDVCSERVKLALEAVRPALVDIRFEALDEMKII